MTGLEPLLPLATWIPVLDGNPAAAALYNRHYSSLRSRARREERSTLQFGGPSERMIIMSSSLDALFGWRRQRYRADEQSGVECFIFRNEGFGVASDMIRAADAIADMRWRGERHFTFVNPRHVRGNPPGNCFRRAGWSECGRSTRGLIVLERAAA